MENIKITKETTVQSYGEFWNAFQHLKELIDTSQQGWSKIKLSALTMVCFLEQNKVVSINNGLLFD
jgi:hypothetical protein